MSGVEPGGAPTHEVNPTAPVVGVVIVSHDGARWLPTVIEGVRAQRRPVDRVVAVDTSSRDQSAALLEDAFGAVHIEPGGTGFPAAVRAGVALLGPEVDWVWLLHDDATPHPDALHLLLEQAASRPDAAVLGPKLREWPSLRRLLELGVTISGTGRRETGLERGEYDQGQHDEVRRVLAVNTAGMLVRRDVLDALGGFDDQLPVFGNDLDFGWRAAAAGHTTLVVPDAVVFHAEAAHRGTRRTPLTGQHTHFQERRAALYTLLANSRARWLPLQVLRLALGTLLRMLGFLAVRQVGTALDELAALVSVLGSPRQLLAARRARQGRTVAARREVRALLAPWWLPYRHGLDAVTDLVDAATSQAADVAERRRAAAAERDPASFAARRVQAQAADDELPEDTGVVVRFLTNPIAVLLALVVLASLIGARAAFGSVAGGGLSPAPADASAWWGTYLASWHPLGLGTPVPAPPYLLPLALLGTLLGGSAGLVVSAVLITAVPVALWGAWRFLRVVGRLVSPQGMPRWLLLWGAVTYALVPVTSGAYGDGRLGPVVAAALLPWLAHAALGFAEPDADRRWRAAFRSGLLLTLVVTVTPTAWLFAVVLGAVVTGLALRIVPGAVRDRSAWGPPATAVGLPVLLLLPWWLPAVRHRAAEALLLDAGRPPAPSPHGLDLLVGRIGDVGAPVWLGVLLAVAALAALVPRASRIPVLVCWIAASTAAVVALVLSWITLDLPAVSVAPGTSFLVVALQGAFVVAAVLGAQALVPLLDPTPARRGPQAPAWARTAAAGVAAVVALVPLVGLGWFVVGPDNRLGDGVDPGIPAYMEQAVDRGRVPGVLVLRGGVADGLRFDIRRGAGVRLGDDEILDQTRVDPDVASAVETLVSRPSPASVAALADEGISYIVLAAPADGDVAATLDATGGLAQASAEDRETRAWQIQRGVGEGDLSGHRSWVRLLLLVIQGAALVVVAVQCGPARRHDGGVDAAVDATVDSADDPHLGESARDLGRRGRRIR